ncbi:uncharacterized protein [Ptychodera flava]|uniref:uncharacterized protein n=1 Tax=Ptychodera flava TaxID=63121 RepID=UPI00396AA10D
MCLPFSMVGNAVCTLSTLSTALFLTGFIFAYVSDHRILYILSGILTVASASYAVGTLIVLVRHRKGHQRLPTDDEEEMECLEDRGENGYQVESGSVTQGNFVNEVQRRDFEYFDDDDDDDDVDITDNGNELVDVDLDDSRKKSKRGKITRI